MYDAPAHIDTAITSIKIINKIFRKRTNGKNDELHKKYKQYETILRIFLNDDFSFKSVDEIIESEEISKLDKRIIYAMLSSKTFLSTVDLNNLSQNGLQLLYESLTYTCQLDAKQIEWQKELDSIQMDIIKNAKLGDKIDFINKYLTNISNSRFFKSNVASFRNYYLNMIDGLLKDNFKLM